MMNQFIYTDQQFRCYYKDNISMIKHNKLTKHTATSKYKRLNKSIFKSNCTLQHQLCTYIAIIYDIKPHKNDIYYCDIRNIIRITSLYKIGTDFSPNPISFGKGYDITYYYCDFNIRIIAYLHLSNILVDIILNVIVENNQYDVLRYAHRINDICINKLCCNLKWTGGMGSHVCKYAINNEIHDYERLL